MAIFPFVASQLTTVWPLTPASFAKSACVRPRRLRNARTPFPLIQNRPARSASPAGVDTGSSEAGTAFFTIVVSFCNAASWRRRSAISPRCAAWMRLTAASSLVISRRARREISAFNSFMMLAMFYSFPWLCIWRLNEALSAPPFFEWSFMFPISTLVVSNRRARNCFEKNEYFPFGLNPD